MQKFSILDLSPVPEGSTTAEALAQTVDLAQHAETLGYHRFWLAEHHNMAGIASAATSVVIGHVAAHTSRIRVGAGGIMLPNHAPLIIAEQFGTLGTLFPGRIDLGLGRAPGTDIGTARALRRNMDAGDTFPQDVVELINYLDDPQLDAKIVAVPGVGTKVPVWILGSSLFGAQLAAYLGLPYAFASHFAPAALEAAAHAYRSTFQPSRFLDKPYFMMAAGVFAADTDEQATFLKSSQLQAFANLRSGRPGRLPRPVPDVAEVVPRPYLESAEEALMISACGSPATVRSQLEILLEAYAPDELLVTSMIHDHGARKHSFALAADILSDLARPAKAA
ncbi:LLM class flavin-dependent oxidoreductase [Falsirhodobacter sp. alg1]|uniref:LLM class flavin-dependent oxidoreductase n=1 Tax=Falsirhodobacter sp. alg1 TaxID=1472418 RepID=UPI0005F0B4C5|nr:LLM class flavin-dependent oxidoreductase [Falsirhodobacter sp. alg1]